MHIALTWEEWCVELQAAARPTHGEIADYAPWRDYFDEGHTPSEAANLDLQQI